MCFKELQICHYVTRILMKQSNPFCKKCVFSAHISYSPAHKSNSVFMLRNSHYFSPLHLLLMVCIYYLFIYYEFSLLLYTKWCYMVHLRRKRLRGYSKESLTIPPLSGMWWAFLWEGLSVTAVHLRGESCCSETSECVCVHVSHCKKPTDFLLFFTNLPIPCEILPKFAK